MDLASRLELCFDSLRWDDLTNVKMQYNLSATQAECQYAEANVTTSRNDMNEIIDLIKMHEILVLHTVSQTKVFTRLLPEHFNDRGILNRVEIGSVGDDTRRKIHGLLLRAGLKKGDEDFFHFPA
ncbi:hypothetical protein EUGRSUZ_A01908 [Eucalyptus grandis]|uniref:Uncharacterized protein n=2 Tax=Eucalyptus grandis TaxID=71139 RepID=A0ACC3M5Z4_EUCGR|nr:hypothetical protein EUGRSUZ_A01908 [Eucalyptus grandis]